MKRFISLTLSILFLLSLSFPAFAEIVPFSNEDITAKCKIMTSGRSLTASASISTHDMADTLKIVSFSIQEYRDGKWISVRSVSNVIKRNGFTLSKSLSYTGQSGYQYRAVARFSVTVNGVTRTLSQTSSTITL